MKFKVISIFPDMIRQALEFGVVGQAQKKSLFSVEIINPRDFTHDVHRTVDDRPFGGGDGMIMQAEVIAQSLAAARAENPEAPIIFLSPQGSTLKEEKVQELAKHKSLILLTARYGGLDQRVVNQWVDEEISIGDYVISGGELSALVVIEAVSRKIPGVLGHHESASEDSFALGLLEAPLFTRPHEWQGKKVPEILRGGHHVQIQKWRQMMSWLVTYEKRRDLFAEACEKIIQSAGPGALRKHLDGLHDFYTDLNLEDRQTCGLTGACEGIWRRESNV